jgi:hypothetical protein
MRRLKLFLKRCKQILAEPPPGLDESNAYVRYLETNMTSDEFEEYLREQFDKNDGKEAKE